MLLLALGIVAADPQPDPVSATAMIESAVRETLKDPDSAQFKWNGSFRYGWYRRPFGKKHEGWITCGTINAKNSYGGYTGRQAVIGIIQAGSVVETDIDDGGGPYDQTFVADACAKIGTPAY